MEDEFIMTNEVLDKDPLQRTLIGVDVGGSFTKAALVADNKIVYKTQVPTKAGLDAVFECIDDILAKHEGVKPAGIGIGIAGMVAKQRVLISAANLDLPRQVDVAGMIEVKYKIPTRIGNDVSCFAMAESKNSGLGNLVYIALGTGVNIGVINNGKLFSGANGVSLEYGHTSLFPDQKPCECGLSGCVEQFVSGKALMSFAKKAKIIAAKPEEVFAASRPIAESFLACLSIVLLNITNTYRPQKIFIGGGLAALIEPYIEKLNDDLKAKNYGYKGAPAVTVEISKNSTDGGVLGAALLVS